MEYTVKAEEAGQRVREILRRSMGVSYTALVNRFRELELLEYRPLEEYIEGDLGIRKGGA